MAEAESPTRDDQESTLRERALGPVVTNTAIGPFWLIPFTLLVSALTRNEIDHFRLQTWIGAAVVSTIMMVAGVAAFRHTSPRPAEHTTDRWVVMLLRVGLASMGFVFGMSTWVASSASIEMVMLFAVFPSTAGALAAMLTAGRRDMFLSLLIPMASASALTLVTSTDIRLRGLAVLWLFYAALLTVIHSTLNKTARTALLLQMTSEDLLAEIERDQVKLTETNAQLAISIEQLTHQATHDALTGLLNRRGMFETLESLVGETATDPVGVLFLDLDRFKAVNDTLGHRGGDHFLRIVADRIERCVAANGLAGRIGGDEFIVALPVPTRRPRSQLPISCKVCSARPSMPRGASCHRRSASESPTLRRTAATSATCWPTPTSRSTKPRPPAAAASRTSTPNWPATTASASTSSCGYGGPSTTATSSRSSSPSSTPAPE